jgi:hypothetical protein
VKEEVEDLLPRSVYFLGSRKEEPPNYNYLHEKSVLRAIINAIQTKFAGENLIVGRPFWFFFISKAAGKKEKSKK